MHKKNQTVQQLLPFAAEASWVTGRWDMLKQYVSLAPQTATGDFNISIGRVLLALLSRHQEDFDKRIAALQEQIACSLSPSTTSTLSACRDQMLKFHVLTELKYMSEPKIEDRQLLFENLERRLAAIGAYLHDKQYLMGIRRAVMQINRLVPTDGTWTTLT
jgi:serine/threonine-protein kinase ATR